MKGLLKGRLDSAVALAVASTASGGAALLAIAWLATRRLSSAELGFFFSFLSFGAFIQLADFGLSYAALQTGGKLAGTGRLGELPAIARHVTRWITVAAGIATIAAGLIGGAIFFSSPAGVAWQLPWIAYLCAAFALQVITPGVFLREGSGRVVAMWRLRLVQEWTGAIACILALYFGAGLWSLAAYAGAKALAGAAILLLRHPLRADAENTTVVRWMRDVWPFQWKIGVSGMSGFLIFRAFAPVVLFAQGPEAAGSFGLAISLMNLLIAVSSSWPMSRAARYSSLAAARRFNELHGEYPRMVGASTVAAIFGTAAAIALIAVARSNGLAFALTLPEPRTTIIILATSIVHHIVICFGVVLRAEGREPLLIPSVVGGLVTVLAIWIAATYGTLFHVAAVNFALALLGIPIAWLLLRHRERQLRATG